MTFPRDGADPYSALSREDLLFTLAMTDRILHCDSEVDFHQNIRELSDRLHFEFILYAYMKSSYDRSQSIHFVNMANPDPWMEEYHRENLLEVDPVRIEIEKRLADGNRDEFIYWDAYERALSHAELMVIERRASHGLAYGCTAFYNSQKKDSLFVLSLASRTQQADSRTEAFCALLLPHLNSCRKRIDLLSSIGSLSGREKEVGDWLIKSKSNWEISQIMKISESTVKYHMSNIFKKLQVSNRQGAVSILLAAQYLS